MSISKVPPQRLVLSNVKNNPMVNASLIFFLNPCIDCSLIVSCANLGDSEGFIVYFFLQKLFALSMVILGEERK